MHNRLFGVFAENFNLKPPESVKHVVPCDSLCRVQFGEVVLLLKANLRAVPADGKNRPP